jgi:hypothetical protein
VPAANAKPRKASPRKKGEAARGEKKDKSKTVDFRGVKLTLPAKLSGTLLWDFQTLMGGDERSLGGIIDFLESLVGAEQSRLVRSKVREDDLDIEETFPALEDLMQKVFEESGVSQGE